MIKIVLDFILVGSICYFSIVHITDLFKLTNDRFTADKSVDDLLWIRTLFIAILVTIYVNI